MKSADFHWPENFTVSLPFFTGFWFLAGQAPQRGSKGTKRRSGERRVRSPGHSCQRPKVKRTKIRVVTEQGLTVPIRRDGLNRAA